MVEETCNPNTAECFLKAEVIDWFNPQDQQFSLVIKKQLKFFKF